MTVTSLSESKGDDKRGELSGDGATSRHHALWSSVYTEMHVNDVLLRERGDRSAGGGSQIMLMMGFEEGARRG